MRPPQERPTRQAVSSATPNSSIFGSPVSMTSIASAMDRPLDAAAGDGSLEIAIGIDDQMAADRTWRRAPGFHHGGDRHGAAFAHPVFGDLERIVMELF